MWINTNPNTFKHVLNEIRARRVLEKTVTCSRTSIAMAPFGCADKPAEKHHCLICCERKILLWLKKTS
jgi:hypothetical protein